MASSNKLCCFGKKKPAIPQEIIEARKAYESNHSSHSWNSDQKAAELKVTEQRIALLDRIKKQVEAEAGGPTEVIDVVKQIISIEETREHDIEKSAWLQLSDPVKIKVEYLPENSRLGDYALWILTMMKKYENNPLVLELGGNILLEYRGVLARNHKFYYGEFEKSNVEKAKRNLPPLPSAEIVEWTLSYSGPFWETTSNFLMSLFVIHVIHCGDKKAKENSQKLFHATTKKIAKLAKQNQSNQNGDGGDLSAFSIQLLHIWGSLKRVAEVSSSLMWDTEDAFSSFTWALFIYGKYPRAMAVDHIFQILSMILPDKQGASPDFSRYWKSQEFTSLFKSFVPNILRCSKNEYTPVHFWEFYGIETMHASVFEVCGSVCNHFSSWLLTEGGKPGFRLIFRQQDFLGSIIETLDILANDSDWKNDPDSKKHPDQLIIFTLFILSQVKDDEYTRASLKRMSSHLLNFDFKILPGIWGHFDLLLGSEKLTRIKNHLHGLRSKSNSKTKDKSQGSGAQNAPDEGEKEVEAAIKIFEYLEPVEQLIDQEEEMEERERKRKAAESKKDGKQKKQKNEN